MTCGNIIETEPASQGTKANQFYKKGETLFDESVHPTNSLKFHELKYIYAKQYIEKSVLNIEEILEIKNHLS
jgi:hypothetical protein